jgi:hypothetical protein
MKKMTLLILCSVFSLFAQNTVLIQGQALNGSADSTAIAGLELALQKMAAGPSGEMSVAARTTSGNDGQFHMQIPAPDSSANYFVAADYQGASYFSEVIRISNRDLRIPARIVVFDSTHDHSSVSTLMHHIFIQDAGANVSVREMRVLYNPLHKTILNAMPNSVEPEASLSLELPAGAEQFSALNAHFDTELKFKGHTVYFMDILVPGNRQVGYVYELPWQNDQVVLSLTAAMPSRSTDFFIANPEWSVSATGLTDHGPFTIRDKTFQRFGAQNLKYGEPVQIVLQRKTAASVEHPYYAVGLTAGLLALALIAARMRKSVL